jgi:glyoxylase-like metal-dependent hydrolase (beta-lactamase superfamily II)
MSWKIERVVVGPIQCNCYVLSEPTTRKAYLIDPGAESNELLNFLRDSKLDVQAVLITHSHIDHIGGIDMVHRHSAVPVYYHGADRELYQNVQMQAEAFGFSAKDLEATQPTVGDGTLTDEQVFSVSDEQSIQVIHTPGHTPGSVCFYADGPAATIFTGDTLFLGSIGRTDLWGGSFEQIIRSIKTRLLILSDETKVLPGHGLASTIGDERGSNPFLLHY